MADTTNLQRWAQIARNLALANQKLARAERTLRDYRDTAEHMSTARALHAKILALLIEAGRLQIEGSSSIMFSKTNRSPEQIRWPGRVLRPGEQPWRDAVCARLTRAFDGLGPEWEAFGRELRRRVGAGEPWRSASRRQAT